MFVLMEVNNMKFSTKGRYALRVIIDLAEHNSGNYIPLTDIAARQEISEKYLESIVSVLSKNGYVDAMRGKGGGYRLNRSPDEYTVGSIIRLIEGNLSPVSCLEPGAAPCSRRAECRTISMWTGLQNLINDYLDGITVGDLIRDETVADYVI
jgi:Rrf2 family protein